MRILYVEDNPANVFLVKRVARMGNHEVVNLMDGDQVLNQFNTIDPDLVLMDVQLIGNLSGLDVVRQLRQQGKTTPIIAVTAYAMVGDRERCIEAGCDDYMAKPLPIQRLVEIFAHYDKEKRRTTAEVVAIANERLGIGKASPPASPPAPPSEASVPVNTTSAEPVKTELAEPSKSAVTPAPPTVPSSAPVREQPVSTLSADSTETEVKDAP